MRWWCVAYIPITSFVLRSFHSIAACSFIGRTRRYEARFVSEEVREVFRGHRNYWAGVYVKPEYLAGRLFPIRTYVAVCGPLRRLLNK